MNNEVKNLIERLRDWYNTSDECNRKDMTQAADLLERIYSQPVELPEPDLHDGITVTKQGKYKSTEDGFTADQLTKAVQESTARALEAAAKVADDTEYCGACESDVAKAIRNLIGRVK